MPNKTGELVRDNPVGAPHIRELSWMTCARA
jgi:hypothetical protein